MIIKKHYDVEKVGQIDFFELFKIPYSGDNSVLVEYTDGIYHGNLIEFKLSISNVGKVLMQAIKYLSKMRIKGIPVVSRILLVDLNSTKVYVYNTITYIKEVQKVYLGSASKNNEMFKRNAKPVAIYDYSTEEGFAEVKKLLVNHITNPSGRYMVNDEYHPLEWYTPIDINEDCIVGWAERYYREVKNATKGSFIGDDEKINSIGEIRNPTHFKGLINPYKEPTNKKFKYLMDCLNDNLNKKLLGAFYTHLLYAKLSAKLLLLPKINEIIKKHPASEGWHYIILDRCAGTGNLELALYGLYDDNGTELISRCVVSTYEYYEYKVLIENIGQDVLEVIPANEENIVFKNGKIENANALSKEYILNPALRKYVNDEKCIVVMYENPPYFDCTAITYNEGSDPTKRVKTDIGESFVAKEFKEKILPTLNEKNASARESSNLFIWSAFQYYLRKPDDCYIVYSPVKYFKNIGLINKKMVNGLAFNREHFHASESVVSCILWENVDDFSTNEWNLKTYDIDYDEVIPCDEKPVITIKKCFKNLAVFNDKRKFVNDTADGILCESDGTECVDWKNKLGKCSNKSPIYNENIIAYMASLGFMPDPKHRYLTTCMYRGGFFKFYGFMMRKDNYLEKLPMWVCKLFPMNNWYDKDIYSNTSDGGDAFINDKEFLKRCLIYTCLSNQNKCLSFTGSDGRFYKNNLCFDNTNGNTTASDDLSKMELDDDENVMIDFWSNILDEAKKTKNYNSALTYGVYQISKELNTFHEEGKGSNRQLVADYPILNGYLKSLNKCLAEYYDTHITEKMLKYQLVK